jgi:hypothetical protein
LRGRLTRRGQEHVLATYPSWQETAKRFGGAVERLLDSTHGTRSLTGSHPTAPSPR